MDCEAVALSEFAHGDIDAVAGRIVRHRNGALISQTLAEELERAGLVRIRMTKNTGQPQGKVADDGQGQPSSSLPAAQASPTKTSNSSKSGGMKTRKIGT